MQKSKLQLKNKKLLNIKAGFAILYAVLVSSILLAIGLAIFNIAIKELLFSSLGRESQFAFYAADTGAECALYWDFEGSDPFSTSTPPAENVKCGGELKPITSTGPIAGVYTREFQIDFDPEPYCAIVSVTKYDSSAKTIIESRGYNTCITSNPRRVERGIKVTYTKL